MPHSPKDDEVSIQSRVRHPATTPVRSLHHPLRPATAQTLPHAAARAPLTGGSGRLRTDVRTGRYWAVH